MAIKKQFTSQDRGVEKNTDILFKAKLDSRFAHNGTSAKAFVYQTQEIGRADVSANGSATVVQAFSFGEKLGKILYANANVNHSALGARWDVTASQIQIIVYAVTGGNISAVTTSSFKINYQVIGSDNDQDI